MRSILPCAGNVIRKNLAVFGADDWTEAKPLDCNAVIVMMTLCIWFCDYPTEADPIEQCVMPSPVDDAVVFHFAAM